MKGTTTKSKLLALLEAQRGQLISGEDVAQKLQVSRAAVWKAAQSLRQQGVEIEAVQGGGYRLPLHSDVLSPEGMAAALPHTPLRVLQEVDSTNLEAKRWAIEGAPHGSMVMAARQTAGRGRLGRSFTSPDGGLYLSIVLRPRHLAPQQAVLVTAAASVAVCRAVHSLCGLQLGIKWVNDLFIGSHKCCGILCEAGTGVENGTIEYIVAGIGLNYSTCASAFSALPEGTAASLYPNGGAPVPRAQLAAAIYRNVTGLFNTLPDTGFLAEYRQHSIVLGHKVTIADTPPVTGTAFAIDDEARLWVRMDDGTERCLSYGEISIKL